MGKGADMMAGDNARSRWNVAMCFGAALALFSCFVVTYRIYTARWWFIDIRPDYGEPPTISRAIVEAEIRVPFAFWITISGVCLVISVVILSYYYRRVSAKIGLQNLATRLCLNIGLPLAIALQIVSAWGMYTLSVNSLFAQNGMHMLGSYAFFAAQAAVVLIYAIWNGVLLQELSRTQSPHADKLLSWRWVRLRLAACVIAVGMTVTYLGLFMAKQGKSFAEAPALIWAYTGMEVSVITAFLIIVVMAFADKLRRPVDI